MHAGKLAASPNPRNARAMPNVGAVVAAACAMAATLHTVTATEKPMRVPNLSSNRPVPSRPMAYAATNAVVMLLYSISFHPMEVSSVLAEDRRKIDGRAVPKHGLLLLQDLVIVTRRTYDTGLWIQFGETGQGFQTVRRQIGRASC